MNWVPRDLSHAGLGPEQGYDVDNPVPTWDAATGLFVPGPGGTGGGAERLVQDGASPPVDLTLEDETDYLYEDV